MINLGIVMDPISSINIKKDTSFALLLEAQKRGYAIYYMEINSLYLYKGEARALSRLLSIRQDQTNWYQFNEERDIHLGDLNIILMRKDPPLDMKFIDATYILERAEDQGVLIINKPKSLRDCNEKLFADRFSHHIPETLVSCQPNHIRSFVKEYEDIILKPINNMGGTSIFRVKKNDPNLSVIIETITQYGQNYCMAQRYQVDIKNGDKRVLVIDGEPVPYCLARFPKHGETRANLAAGGRGEARPLSEVERKIATDVALVLKEKGLIFAGLDIIGNYLIEINITSPTCIREIEEVMPISITGMIMDVIEKRLLSNTPITTTTMSS